MQLSYLFFFTENAHLKQCDDCACSEATLTSFETKNYSSDTQFTAIKDNYFTKLNDEFYLGFSPYAPAGPSVLNQEAFERYQCFLQSPQPISLEIDKQFAQQNLIVPLNHTPEISDTAPSQLSVWLHVTNACNLDCAYCYIQKSSEYMDEDIGKQTIDKLFAIAQTQQFKHLRLKYAGGEALLHFKFIKKIHEYAQKIAQKEQITLSAVILSNGVAITPQMANWLKQEDIKLMISIDGIGTVHDEQRPDKRGKGSFQRIQKTIYEILLPLEIKPEISITVTGINANFIANVVEWALHNKLVFHLNLYRHPSIFPTPLLKENLTLEQQHVINGIRAAYKVIEENLPNYPFLNNLLDKMQSTAHTHTCGVGKNYVVVDHHGQFSQCQMQINQTIPSKLATAIAVLPTLATSTIRNLPIQDKTDCQTCEFRYRCTGGCPIETHRVTGRWDIKSPHCNIYKTLYPEALRLEGLRLLKLHEKL
ncbi:radical SAM/SPASM domain-containing protein [Beggiatoa leptomitoformis]|uniref:SPASM domain-containing protein n=1 Tax=Beggiatoa leptomitoformis TaxID=288004 RepID=A0A2N9YBB9_9GAMM|nr:SPASM domain-containing protein [Beggiatoa leptomitoformis]AUI67742.1 SPASM domain-containing protein [Beggiatoa leptomitoformis]QGX03511.1 SPASM domain-containing protein [Beggiatoa leptomitoformis]